MQMQPLGSWEYNPLTTWSRGQDPLSVFVRNYHWARRTQQGTRRKNLHFAWKSFVPCLLRPWRRWRSGWYAPLKEWGE